MKNKKILPKRTHKDIEIEDTKQTKKNIKKINLKFDITDEINYKNENVCYNTPILIEYKNKQFKLETKNYYDKIEVTWKCINRRKTKNKPVNMKNFCDGTIKGIRNVFENKIFRYYFKFPHSEICLKLDDDIETYINSNNNFKSLPNENKKNDFEKSTKPPKNLETKLSEHNSYNNEDFNNKKQTDKNDQTHNEDFFKNNKKNISDIKGYTNLNLSNDFIKKCLNAETTEEIDKLILDKCKNNKIYLTKLNKFINTFACCYKNRKNVKYYHLKYLFTKYKNECFPESLDEIYNYCNYIQDLGYFCRDVSKKILINSKKEFFTHSHIIFFTDDNLLRLIASENIINILF